MPSDKYQRRTDSEFDKLDYDTRAAFWYSWKWVGGCVLAVLAITCGLWAFGVFSSDVKGAGDAHKQNQSSTNRIAKQEWFQQTYQDIQTADLNVDTMYQMREADPSYPNKVNYTAAIAHCQQLRGNYNAEAKKYTSEAWRDNTLPEQIDASDPKFDCKENTK